MTVQAKTKPDDTRARIIETSNHVIRVRIPLRVSLFTGVVAVRVTTPFGTSPVTRARFRSIFPVHHSVLVLGITKCRGQPCQ